MDPKHKEQRLETMRKHLLKTKTVEKPKLDWLTVMLGMAVVGTLLLLLFSQPSYAHDNGGHHVHNRPNVQVYPDHQRYYQQRTWCNSHHQHYHGNEYYYRPHYFYERVYVETNRPYYRNDHRYYQRNRHYRNRS